MFMTWRFEYEIKVLVWVECLRIISKCEYESLKFEYYFNIWICDTVDTKKKHLEKNSLQGDKKYKR